MKIEVERTRVYSGAEVMKMLDEQMKLVMECLPDAQYTMMKEAYKQEFTSNLKSKGLI